MKKVTKVKWFARGGGIQKMGPYDSQVDAVQALMTTKGFPVEGAFVWPEKVTFLVPKG
jgi:hypothetical protein